MKARSCRAATVRFHADVAVEEAVGLKDAFRHSFAQGDLRQLEAPILRTSPTGPVMVSTYAEQVGFDDERSAEPLRIICDTYSSTLMTSWFKGKRRGSCSTATISVFTATSTVSYIKRRAGIFPNLNEEIKPHKGKQCLTMCLGRSVSLSPSSRVAAHTCIRNRIKQREVKQKGRR